jgi:predicted NAD/FAD-dependent oxidoreductase
VDIRFEQKIETLEKHPEGRYRLLGEEFDALILTPPIPQTAELLASIGEFRPINNVRFRSCLSVLMGFEKHQEFKYHALIEPEQRHPMTWLSIESAKSPGRAPEGCTALVAQLSPSYSQNHYDSPDETIIRDTLQYVGRVLGPGWDALAVSDVKRWRFSQPEMTAMYETVNPPNSRILIAGDGVMGARVEYAYESGFRAAKQLMGEE